MAVNNLPFRDIRKVASMATTFFVIFDQTLSYRIQWYQREKLVLQLMSLLTHFKPMFHLWKNQVDGFYLQNV